jgi:hypothetical protein
LNARPPAPKGEESLPKAPSFTPEFQFLQQLGESAFSLKATQVESTVRVLAQFRHSKAASAVQATTRNCVSRIQGVHQKWQGPHPKVPAQLNRARCTPRQDRAGLAESAARCAAMLAEALGGVAGRVEKFRRDGCARPWPVGLEMLCYMLAHQLGFPLPNEGASGIWNWEKLWKECEAPGGPGSDS